MSLRGADSVHLASALDRSCEEFVTLDSRISKISNKEKFAKLGLRLIEGRSTTCLPEKYYQLQMSHEIKRQDKGDAS
jgi:hypothetical protein